MKKRKPKKADDGGAGAEVSIPTPPLLHSSTPPLLRVGLALLVAAGVVAGLGWAGRRAGLGLVGRGRYAVPVAAVECPAPPGTDRATFLLEVRYLGDLPETVSAVDPGMPAALGAAFRKHPWVEAVDGVTAGPGPAVAARLRFRVPVLAVSVRGSADRAAVDAGGVRLPPAAPLAGLAELVPPVAPSRRPAGERWDDPDVVRAAELAKEHGATRVERLPGGWRVTRAGGGVLNVGP